MIAFAQIKDKFKDIRGLTRAGKNPPRRWRWRAGGRRGNVNGGGARPGLGSGTAAREEPKMALRKKASEFDQRILELYDGYVHGRMSKRAFLDHAAKYTVGGVTAAALLESLQPDYALAQQVADMAAPWIELQRSERSGGGREGKGEVAGFTRRRGDAE